VKRGAWHQCGDKSQRLVAEQLEAGFGVGVILSPRDLTAAKAAEYAAQYSAMDADVMIDPQFYVPDFTNDYLETYTISQFRQSVSSLNQISDSDITQLAAELQTLNASVQSAAIIAPAVLYEAGRHDILQLNAKLFAAAKVVGQNLGVPTLATVGLARSVTSSPQTIAWALNAATALDADGWYYAFEFEDERIPSGKDAVYRCCDAGLTLATTGKPVLHAYAGPMGLLAFGFGASAVGIGHSQNLWKFTRDRWEGANAQGGGGNAPARFFSSALWGTIIYPDETGQLPAAVRAQVLTPATPFCEPVLAAATLPWKRWEAGKHLVCVLAQTYDSLAGSTDARAHANAAVSRLTEALSMHAAIKGLGFTLGDGTDAYQANWRLAMSDLLTQRATDFDYLEVL